jgi:hypothetical protein
VGAYIKVWDPDNHVWRLENEFVNYAFGAPTETFYNGHVCWPSVQRVYGITMPVREGMGVYLVRGDGDIIDLTRYVKWETGTSTIEVGAPPRRVSSSVKRRGVGR